MRVNMTNDTQLLGERVTDILMAACRVISRTGIRKLNLGDVAQAAGVSKALIHYYFESREDVIVQAYEFADRRAQERVRTAVIGPESAAVRLKRLLLMYFQDDDSIKEDWIIWSELSASAVFEPKLRPAMETAFAKWTAWLEALIKEAIDDGSLSATTDVPEMALRLSALVDGLGSQVVRGLVSYARACEILTRGLERELDGSPQSGDIEATPATGYLRLLATLFSQGVGELDKLASTDIERDAIGRVCSLIAKVTGGWR